MGEMLRPVLQDRLGFLASTSVRQTTLAVATSALAAILNKTVRVRSRSLRNTIYCVQQVERVQKQGALLCKDGRHPAEKNTWSKDRRHPAIPNAASRG